MNTKYNPKNIKYNINILAYVPTKNIVKCFIILPTGPNMPIPIIPINININPTNSILILFFVTGVFFFFFFFSIYLYHI